MRLKDITPHLDYSATLQAFFNSHTYNIILVDNEGILQGFNEGAARAAREIQGVEYRVGMDFFENIPEPSREKVRERHGRVLAGESLNLEITYPGVDRINHWYELQYDPVRDEKGDITGLCLTSICIDDRKKNEENLRESEEKFRKFFEDASMAMAMVSDYRFIKVNRALLDMLGYSEEELVGKSLYDITHPDDLSKTRVIATLVHQGELERFQSEKRYLRKDGQSLWANVSGTVIRDPGGKKLYSMIMIENITERKATQEALRKSEADLRSVFNSGSQLMILLSPDGLIWDCNSSAVKYIERMTGKKVEKGRPFTDYMSDNQVYNKEFEQHRAQALKGEVVTLDRVIKAANGSEFWLGVSYNPVYDAGGTITGVCMTAIAIDERKKAEQALRKSEADLRAVFNSGSQMVTLLDTHGHILDCNKNAKTNLELMTGMPMAVGKPLTDYMELNQDFKEEFKDDLKRTLKGEAFLREKAVKIQDGSRYWLEFSYTPIYEADGNISGVCMTATDIDERKKAEAALLRSEADLKAVFNSGSQVTVLINQEGRIQGFNKSAELMSPRVLGRKLELGMLFSDTLPPGASQELYQKSFQNGLAGIETKGERAIRAADGRERWVEVNYQPVVNDQGGVNGVCFSLTFIDERKKADRDLRESEERYRKLIEFSPEAVVVHSGGKILYVNSSGLKMLGTDQSEKIVGKMILDFVHPDYREISLSRIQKISDKGEPTEWTEQKLLRVDGQMIETETKGTPFVFQGRPAVLTIVRDITDRKKTQGMLLRYERLAAVGNVIAAIAHEIRNPLAVVSGMSQILKAKLESRSEFSQELATILSQTDRLRLFMNDILNYSRETEIKKEKVDLQTLLEQSLVTAQTQFGPRHAGITVKKELENPVPELFADGERLEQVLVNLILNAYQAMQDKGILTLSCSVKEGWVYLGIKDDGPGINENDLPRLFEPFFTTKKHGSGLGLSISQKIVEAHGGKIETRRAQPNGMIFTIQLPLQKA